MIRPESQIIPVEANANGKRLHSAGPRPNACHATTKTPAVKSAWATAPPLTSAIGLAPQARAWGRLRSTATVPLSYQAAIVFSTRAPGVAAMMPFLNVSTGGVTLPFKLVADLGDARRVYMVPACADGWPADARIVVTAEIGLPDGFGRPLAAAVKGNFMTSRIAATPVDGACGPLDAGAATPDAADGAQSN